MKVHAGANAYNAMGSYHIDHVDVNMLNKSYREVGKHYVKIQGHGLFHTGANPLKQSLFKSLDLSKIQKEASLFKREIKKDLGHGSLMLHNPIKSDLKIDPRTKDIEGVRKVLASAGVKFGSSTPLGTSRSHMQDLGYEGDSLFNILVF